MKFSKTYILILIISSFIIYETSAQLPAQNYYKKSEWSYGGYFSYSIPKYNLNFNQLPGIPNCCPNFTNGEGSGINAGAVIEFRQLAYNHFRLKAGISLLSAYISQIEPEWIILNEKLSPASFSHEIYASFFLISFEPVYKYSTPIGLSFIAGLNASFILSGNFEQKEILIKPDNQGTFNNGSRIRNEVSGKLNGTNSFLFSPLLGAEFDIKLDRFGSYILTPSFNFYYGLNSIIESEQWNYVLFNMGLALRMNPFKELSSPLEPK